MSDYRIKGETGEWEVVIGLEVHAQVTSNAKLFSGAAVGFGAGPNEQVTSDTATLVPNHLDRPCTSTVGLAAWAGSRASRATTCRATASVVAIRSISGTGGAR